MWCLSTLQKQDPSSPFIHQDPLQSNDYEFYLYRDPLQGNGHRFLYMKTLCEAMIIDSLMFISRPSTSQWSWIFFTSRPSTRQWSSISLHLGPLRGNGH